MYYNSAHEGKMTKQEEKELREKFTLLQHRIKYNNPPMDLDAWYRFEKNKN